MEAHFTPVWEARSAGVLTASGRALRPEAWGLLYKYAHSLIPLVG